MTYKAASNIAKLALLLLALLIALMLNSCGQSKTDQPTRSDSVIIVAKQTIKQAQKTNDSLQAKKDSIPLTRTHNERDDFWANLKRLF